MTRSARDARLRSMVEEHFDTVWRSLKRLGVLASNVDDAAQEVFIVASRKLDEIEAGRERAYLVGVALRVAADARRAVRRRGEVALEGGARGLAEATPAAQPEARIDERRARERLSAVLETMPAEMREAFVLFDLEELTAPEVAAALGVPAGTVASRVRRARDFVRCRLSGKENSDG